MRLAAAFILSVWMYFCVQGCFQTADALEIGIGVGPCDIQGSMPACDDGGLVVHAYAKHALAYIGKGGSLGLEYHHFSKPEKSDLDYGGGSGAFDYGGIYFNWRF